MPDTIFRLARPEDDADLRELCSVPVPGDWIDLSYRREPSFFRGLTTEEDQVLVGRALEGQLLATATRSFWSVYRGGRPHLVEFLHGLRVRPSHQGQFLLWKGFRLLQELEAGEPARPCFATVVEGNRLAESILVRRGRPHWPRFEPSARLFTLALYVGRRYPLRADRPEQEPATQLAEWGSRRELFPARLSTADENRTWLATDRGVAAVRDCRPSRQTVISGYRLPRRLYNLWARLRAMPSLPLVGQALAGAYLGYWCLSPGSGPEQFRQLLEAALEQAREQSLDWLYLGMLENDPFWPVARAYPHRLYVSRLYRVTPPSGQTCESDAQPQYLELADL